MSRAPCPAAAPLLALVLAGAGLAGCAGSKQETPVGPIETSPEAAYHKAMVALSKGNLQNAIGVLERIEYSPDPEARAKIEPLARVAMADATFYQGTSLAWIDARNLYLDFVSMYGDHPLAPYAQLQVGFCSLKQVNHPTKDQLQTHQAIADFEEVIARHPGTTYAEAARSLLRVARSILAESEFLVGKFYLGRKAFPAAINRFRVILERYPDYTETEKVLFHLGQALVLADKPGEAKVYLDQLATRYPASPYAERARRKLATVGEVSFGSAVRPGPE